MTSVMGLEGGEESPNTHFLSLSTGGSKKVAANSRPERSERCEQRRPRCRKASGARPSINGIGRALGVISGVKRLNPYWAQEQIRSSVVCHRAFVKSGSLDPESNRGAR